MAPLAELHAAQDDVAEYAAKHVQPAAPTNLIATLAALPTEQLVAEGNALSARMLSSLHSTRDFAIVQALVQRVQLASVTHALATRSLNREPLDGALWLDLRTPEAA